MGLGGQHKEKQKKEARHLFVSSFLTIPFLAFYFLAFRLHIKMRGRRKKARGKGPQRLTERPLPCLISFFRELILPILPSPV